MPSQNHEQDCSMPVLIHDQSFYSKFGAFQMTNLR